jgi:hypothetical protein
MKSGRTHFLGIRHHGPGSAASVVAALDEINPQIVLIEGPADANHVLQYAAREGMRPPVAILVHDVEDAAKATFIPFAEYSPEWQALQWALARKRPVRLIDLPAGQRFALRQEDAAKEDADEAGDLSPLRRDPLSALAEAAGESDGESWWNGLVEQSAGGAQVFAAIADAMTALRAEAEKERPVPRHEEKREAFMRVEIATALKETEGEIAVICGAWHVPALVANVPAKQDRETLKSASSIKTSATWVPWTDSRLTAASGYGAGVISPGWYRHLWHEFHIKAHDRHAVDVAARWQSSVANLLRREGQLTSSASVIEAARLSISLAALRDFPLPGLAEMQDASLSVMCHGDPILLKLIADRLIIGTEIGEIAEGIPQMPLAEDLQRWQKKLRLKPSASEEELSVDLRTETGLLKSELLHRLLLIQVPWGCLTDAQAGRGTFRENWIISWQPELSVKLAEAMRFGATIEQAAANAALEAAEQQSSLARCAELISLCLNANLPEAAEKLTHKLQALSVNITDIEQLLRAAPPLINILRYGTARKLPREALEGLVLGMCVEISAGLGMASRGLNEDAAVGMLDAMRIFDTALPLVDDEHQRESWHVALAGLEADETSAALLRGFALRRRYDAGIRSDAEAAVRLSRALSPAVPTLVAGQWLEGFLNQSAQLLIHDGKLFALIDDWLMGVPEDGFVELLPVMRRAVGAFDAMERRRLLEKVKSGVHEEIAALTTPTQAGFPPAFEKALPLLKTILGIDP